MPQQRSLPRPTPTTSYYVYDEAGHVIGEYDAKGNPVQEHIYLGDRPVAVVQGGNASNIDYVTTDQLNTPRAVTDSSQTVEWSWTSDPFGNGQPTGSLTYNLRFPGQYYDQETGHSYNYNRDYDPNIGRYIESDPIGVNGGLNTYGYVGNNPVTQVDSRGLCAEDACITESFVAEQFFNAAAFVASAAATAYELHKQNDCRCDAINQQINDKMDELKRRYAEALADKHNLFETRPTGPFSWAGHKYWYEKCEKN